MLKFGILLLTISLSLCLLDPSQFSSQIQKILPQNITMLHQDIGRTLNGYNIMAYGLTAIPGFPAKAEFKDVNYYPSTLITSYMHSTDQNAVNLLYGYVTHLVRNFGSDLYIQTVLKTGIIWLVPYISIDVYEMISKAHRDPKTHPIFSPKNMNKYPDLTQTSIDCQKMNPPKISGVNLDYNFLKQIGQEYSDLCHQKYAGPTIMSQKQTQNIQRLFKILKITAVIDLQIGNDIWVHPQKEIWQNGHKYEYIYNDIIAKSKKLGRQNRQMFEQKAEIHENAQQNQSKFSGGFVNWAALQETVAFKYLITPDTSSDTIRKSISSAFPVMDMIIKKNSPIYNKYRSKDNTKLYIESISLIQFSIRCILMIKNGETVTKDYEIGLGKMVEINIEVDQQNWDLNYDLAYRPGPEVRLYVRGTFIAQAVDILTLPYLPLSNEEQAVNKKKKDQEQINNNLIAGAFIICIMLIVMFLPSIALRWERRNQKNGYVQVNQQNNINPWQ